MSKNKEQPYSFAVPGELHLWVLPIREINPALLPAYYALLTKEELRQNQRYAFEKDRTRHLLTRVFTRKLLAAYSQVDPVELQFGVNAYGRPTLLWPDGESCLDFNLSHAGELIVCSIVQEGAIGVDVEPLDRQVKIHLASSFFSEIELKELNSLPVEQQKTHFLRLWTLKEAYIKACGKGLSIPLDSFAFYNFSDGNMRFWQKAPSPSGIWSFLSLKPSLGHRIAVAWQQQAVREKAVNIRLREFQLSRQELANEEIPCEVEYSW